MPTLTHAQNQELAEKVLKEAKGSISLFRRVRRRWPEWLSLTVDLAAILSFIFNTYFLKDLYSNNLAFFQVSLVYVFLFVLLGLLAWQIYTYSRRSKYAETLAYLHDIVHNTRDTVFAIHRNTCNDANFKYICILNLTFFSQAFSMITGVKCRASLKMIREASEEEISNAPHKYKTLNLHEFRYIAETYARDAESLMSSSQLDGQVNHWLIANTDFEQLMQAQHPQTERFFLCNNLPRNPRYQSTSFDLFGEPARDGEPIKDKGLLKTLKKRSRWPLPYRSTIIWPIRKVTEPCERREKQLCQKQDLIGFLCVDSYARGVFDERYDFDFGALVADNFYLLFGAYRAKLEQRLPMRENLK